MIGEEGAKAGARAGGKVDSLVKDKAGTVKQRIAAVQAEATKRIGVQTEQLDQVQKQLEEELKRLTAGLAPGIKLPKIKL